MTKTGIAIFRKILPPNKSSKSSKINTIAIPVSLALLLSISTLKILLKLFINAIKFLIKNFCKESKYFEVGILSISEASIQANAAADNTIYILILRIYKGIILIY